MRFVLVAAVTLGLLTACSKKESRTLQEYVLYGKWEKGSNDGDTIEFLNRNGQNFLRYYDARFITGIYKERAYRYDSEGLSIQMYASDAFSPIASFTLRQRSNEFSILANELYPLLSLTAKLVYKKIP